MRQEPSLLTTLKLASKQLETGVQAKSDCPHVIHNEEMPEPNGVLKTKNFPATYEALAARLLAGKLAAATKTTMTQLMKGCLEAAAMEVVV